MKAIVVAASSDIGAALCKKWSSEGWKVYGTYRTHSPLVEELIQKYTVEMVHCDLGSPLECSKVAEALAKACGQWDVLVFSSGLMEPVGKFGEVDFSKWEQSLQVNFIRPLQLLHQLLPSRNPHASVLFFAGGGTNNAVTHYTSYALSKISLIKFCEFLAEEIPDLRCVIVGPGWVKTKIHETILKAGAKAGPALKRTMDKIQQGDWTSMESVIHCCHWLVTTNCTDVTGRNFSVAHDAWGSSELEKALKENPNMYKLRRDSNSWTSPAPL